MRNKPEHFDTWSEAYDACRERDQPLLVEVEGVVGTVYPSGHFRPSKTVAHAAAVLEEVRS